MESKYYQFHKASNTQIPSTNKYLICLTYVEREEIVFGWFKLLWKKCNFVPMCHISTVTCTKWMVEWKLRNFLLLVHIWSSVELGFASHFVVIRFKLSLNFIYRCFRKTTFRNNFDEMFYVHIKIEIIWPSYQKCHV